MLLEVVTCLLSRTNFQMLCGENIFLSKLMWVFSFNFGKNLPEIL
jgi:hypothetical protein